MTRKPSQEFKSQLLHAIKAVQNTQMLAYSDMPWKYQQRLRLAQYHLERCKFAEWDKPKLFTEK